MSEISEPTGDTATRSLGALFIIAVLAYSLLQPAQLMFTIALIVLAFALLRGRWRAGVVLYGVVYPLSVGFLMARYDSLGAAWPSGGASLAGYTWATEPTFWLLTALIGVILVLAYRITRLLVVPVVLMWRFRRQQG